ncbi:hypothetical protein [Avibacterium paragallinarum]|uniref:hypothetical protein n=1 Tax=Avibacterium paragallinarum TaxID=728 RepID=UPI00397E5797
MGQKNNFKNANFHSTTQIVQGDVYNINSENKEFTTASYQPEPIWRSKITLAILNWAGTIMGLFSLFPLYKGIIEPIKMLLSSDYKNIGNNYFIIPLIILIALLSVVLMLRNIVKKQLRYPLAFNYAISGKGQELILEKIKTGPCPQCGGKMRYYSKPIEWTGKKVTKAIPALECLRNSEHWYKVDPAEDKV